MREGIHPDYRTVVFQDPSAEFGFLTRSTVTSSETVKWEDGNEYPLVRVEISSASHPFYTGKMKIVDTAGRVERFNRRYAGKGTQGGSKTKSKTQG
ncbi:MAG: type ribosomal protein [Actinomycetia bacterium]|nr:type ribosomal protein [Actinomycetes bacterium]